MQTSRRFRVRASHGLVGLAVAGLLGGCSMFRPRDTTYRPPPLSYHGTGTLVGAGPVVVVGGLGEPTRRPPLDEVGPELSEALRGTLANRRGLAVTVDPSLGRVVEGILAGRGGRAEQFAQLRREQPEARYVVIGQVTDFDHVARDRGWDLLSSKRQALVAIEFSVVDLHAERLVLTDHVHATAPADERDPADVYDHISVSSYRFWSTPLGRASADAIADAAARIEASTNATARAARTPNPAWGTVQRTASSDPPASAARETPRRSTARSTTTTAETFRRDDLDVRVLSVVGPRELRLSAAGRDLRDGDELYLCRLDTRTAHLEPLHDPQTRLPLRVRIERPTWGTPRGWIMGRPDPEVALRGAVLVTTLPPSSTARSGSTLAREPNGDASGF